MLKRYTNKKLKFSIFILVLLLALNYVLKIAETHAVFLTQEPSFTTATTGTSDPQNVTRSEIDKMQSEIDKIKNDNYSHTADIFATAANKADAQINIIGVLATVFGILLGGFSLLTRNSFCDMQGGREKI